MRWVHRAAARAHTTRLCKELGLSRTTATLLARQGICEPEKAQEFLNPRLRALSDPFELTNMDRAVARLRKAMAGAERIVVFGDYDVDGVTSTALLLSVLNTFGVYPRYIVPRRLEEGYGLSMAALDRLLEEGTPDLLIAVDCGTNSIREVESMKRAGVDVIIIDHHTSKADLPEGAIIVNPHVFDPPDQPWSNLCSVGLVFKFVHGLLKQLREEGDDLAFQIDLRDYLDLVALGTVADLVPLLGENRIFARKGLELLRETRRVGLCALFEVAGMKLGDEVTPFDIAFRLSPRINASGRLADASEPIEMLLSEEWQRCRDSAKLLDEFNRERQVIEKEISQQAEMMVEEHYSSSPALVLYHPEWHPGVVGIVASRISSKYHRPTIVLGAEGELAKGSGRTVTGVSLVEVLHPCASYLQSWGGHPMAVGVTMDPAKVDAFREAFCDSVMNCCSGSLPEPELDIACWIDAHELGEELLAQLDLLGPFGQGNSEPIFGLSGVRLESRPTIFGNGHFRFQISTTAGRRMNGVAWRQADNMPPAGVPIDMALRIAWNVWNEQRFPQLRLEGWRPAKANAFSGSSVRA